MLAVPALPVITNLNQAATALDARHAALVTQEAGLLAQATNALDCAVLASNDAAKRAFLGTARGIVADAAAVRVQIDRIEACWS